MSATSQPRPAADPADQIFTAVLPNAATLIRAVTTHNKAAVAQALASLTDRAQLEALAVLLAANVSPDSDLGTYAEPLTDFQVADAVLRETCVRFRVRARDVLSTSRRHEHSEARAVAMAACRLAGLSCTYIGRFFKRDHTTVLHAATRVGENRRLQSIAMQIAEPLMRESRGALGDEDTPTGLDAAAGEPLAAVS